MSKFHLFEGPCLLFRPFEIQRVFFNHLNEYRYKKLDPTYTREGLDAGVKEGIVRIAKDLREKNETKMVDYLGKHLRYRLKLRLPEMDKSVLQQNLNFDVDNIRKVYLHSIFMTMEGVKLTEDTRYTAFVTSIAYIDPKGTGPLSSFQVAKRVNDFLVCNITFGRTVKPMGKWRISDVNFFDPAVTEQLAHVYV
ncbi:unnamed protein product [Bursaphelenchus okinawaensis]|uniref:Tim44-like domain-containing protein n=1 Tax=Bursaphelenchus okinawaensis TaxID=465554 RepID=A0A811KQF5_9BILA|nr:unnamed protein product [Bursaphelenchus okinawaensis]CAG9111441.1 unnamed protein product [Bursaphelenchus okinawaensis]